MKNRFERMAAWATSRFPKAGARWSFMAALAPVFLLQSYFVRVLLTSEFFFALLFLAVLLVAGAAYLVGAVGASWLERSRQNMEKGRPCRRKEGSNDEIKTIARGSTGVREIYRNGAPTETIHGHNSSAFGYKQGWLRCGTNRKIPAGSQTSIFGHRQSRDSRCPREWGKLSRSRALAPEQRF